MVAGEDEDFDPAAPDLGDQLSPAVIGKKHEIGAVPENGLGAGVKRQLRMGGGLLAHRAKLPVPGEVAERGDLAGFGQGKQELVGADGLGDDA